MKQWMNILKVFKESYKKSWYILKISEITRQKQQKETIMIIIINPFHASSISILSERVKKPHTNCLSVFDIFVRLALKWFVSNGLYN